MDKILEPFIENPEKEFHVRQIAKLVNKSPTTISKYLKKFERKDILKSDKKFNHLLFKANTENDNFKRLKLSYNLEILHSSGLIDYIVKEFNYPEAIILFGSFAKAENIPKSDVDLLIISPLKKEINLERFEEKLGHKIQLFINSKKEIEIMKRKNKELLNNFINGVTLYGFLEVFR
ncbi:MAG: nucleotidyltransferase domain-containing protein [Nanoarchaeota archaeon]